MILGGGLLSKVPCAGKGETGHSVSSGYPVCAPQGTLRLETS